MDRNTPGEIQHINTVFFKCIKWEVEETLDPLNCPYHYFCDSVYAGNYPSHIDTMVFLFTVSSYVSTLVLIIASSLSRRKQSKRYLLPSGPIFLPVILLVLAKGQRINTLFPLSCFGPAILQLVHTSALAFNHKGENGISYVLYEASTISGILHASLYLDSILLPYYTGFDALVASTFSGECRSCVCRKDILVVGGKLVSYRGVSATTFLVIGVLFARIVSRMFGDNIGRRTVETMGFLLENVAWVSTVMDCVYLATKPLPEQDTALRLYAFGAITVLVFLHLIIKTCIFITKKHREVNVK